MGTPRLLTVVLALGLAASPNACGGDRDHQGRGAVEPSRKEGASVRSDADVIRAWANTLRGGEISKAASYFALPVIVQNGTPPLKLTTTAEVRAFNAGLPCGARLVRTYSSGRYTTAVFRLTERPGAGRCGSGAGQSARTAFVIRDGKIREWRRVADRPNLPAPVV